MKTYTALAADVEILRVKPEAAERAPLCAAGGVAPSPQYARETPRNACASTKERYFRSNPTRRDGQPPGTASAVIEQRGESTGAIPRHGSRTNAWPVEGRTIRRSDRPDTRSEGGAWPVIGLTRVSTCVIVADAIVHGYRASMASRTRHLEGGWHAE